MVMGAMLASCASPINSHQKAELNVYRAKGYEVTEKNPGTGAALGILPGGGSFYSRNYGLGVLNLLLWPVSILWDPISGHDGSESINYYATKQNVSKMQGKELAKLNDQLEMKAITSEKYMLEKNKIEQKYSSEI